MGAMLVRHTAASVAAVRRSIAADLMTSGVDEERVHDVTLVASELVGNAVRHTELDPGEELGISWTLSPTDVMVSVADAGEGEPRLRVVSADEPSGRGLAIVDQLASTWGVEHLQRGKRVWAQIPIR